ncbi:MAG: glycerophosphodiester phosphodiesterase [Lachnospiraceae bacterium]|nr:glycerophosphodiester phosphodiesterase [Lachnospiraceae bacterium]
MILLIATGILLLLVILYLLMIMPRMMHRPDITPFKSVLYAHRGLHDNFSPAPENSMAAFKKAVDAGFGIELDVQLSKDKVPVVFHDSTLDRICGVEGRVEDFTYEELQQFSLCGTAEKIPKFEDFLKLVDGKVPLIIEYKIPGGVAEVCPIADKLLQAYKGAYCIESFNPLGVLWYRRNRKEVVRGQLADNFIKSGENTLSPLLYFALHHLMFNFLTKPDFIAYNHFLYRDLSRRLCRRLYRAPAAAWTIKNEVELKESRKEFDMFIFDSFVPVTAGDFGQNA